MGVELIDSFTGIYEGVNSHLCKDCICLPMCLNKSTFNLVRQCKLISNNLVELTVNSEGRGKKDDIYFFYLERVLLLEIYTDTLYIIGEDSCAIMGINRKKYSFTNVGELVW